MLWINNNLVVRFSALLSAFFLNELNRGYSAVDLCLLFRLVAGSNVYQNECEKRTEKLGVLKEHCW